MLPRTSAPPLPGAWREVSLRGEQRLLWPLLVTGCKVWHLRADGSFYTRAQVGDHAHTWLRHTIHSLDQASCIRDLHAPPSPGCAHVSRVVCVNGRVPPTHSPTRPGLSRGMQRARTAVLGGGGGSASRLVAGATAGGD
jgi:hypothetical protein